MPGTPILDLEKDPPQPSAKWKLQLIGLALGSAIGFGITKLPIDPVTALLCLPAFYLAVAIHEIGHLIAGKLAGMDPGGLIVGGFAMIKSGERWVFRFDYRNIMCGGLAKPLPPNGEFSRSKFAWMVAGGPLASLLFAAAMGAARLRYGSGPLAWRGSLFWTAVFITIISLVPGSGGVNKTDGARLWMLLRHPARALSWVAMLMIQTEETNGVRPRDWNPKLVKQMLETSPSEGQYLYSEWLAFYRSSDEDDEVAALEHLENALARSKRGSTMLRHCWFLEAAQASALARGNAAHARVWLERASKLRRPLSIASVEASIAICEKRYDDALVHLAAARDFLIRQKLDSGLIRFAKEKLDEYKHQCVMARDQVIASVASIHEVAPPA